MDPLLAIAWEPDGSRTQYIPFALTVQERKSKLSIQEGIDG